MSLAKAEEGLWKGSFVANEEGLYRLKQGDQTALVSAGAADSKEFQDVISDTERLRPIAEATGGSVRRIATNATGDIHLPSVVSVTRSSPASGVDFIGLRGSDSYRGHGPLDLAALPRLRRPVSSRADARARLALRGAGICRSQARRVTVSAPRLPLG